MKQFNIASVSIKKYSELDENAIVQFHKTVFDTTARVDWKQNIRWRYRMGFNAAYEPVYAVYNNEIIGQAALIPAELVKNSAALPIAWYIDLFISPQFQRKGIGELLTKHWQQMCPNHFGYCNVRSMGVLVKAGWQVDISTIRFAKPLNLLSLAKYKGLKGIKLFAARLVQPVYGLWLKLQQKKVSVGIKNITRAEVLHVFNETCYLKINRDIAWQQWRLFASPFVSDYYILSAGNSQIIFRLFDFRGTKRLHLLYQNYNAEANEIKFAVEQLFSYALNKKADLVWAYTNIEKLKVIYSSVFTSQMPARFIFHSNDAAFQKEIAENKIPLQAIDSDSDILYV